MTPNNEQLKSIARWLITLVGGAIAGWAAKSGFITADQVMSILNSETFIGIVVAVIGLIWGMISKTKPAILTAAANIPEVKKIELAPITSSSDSLAEVNRLAKATPPSVTALPRP